MVPLISANTTQLKVAYQEKSFGLRVSEALRTEFLNEISKMSKNWVVSSVRIFLTQMLLGDTEA